MRSRQSPSDVDEWARRVEDMIYSPVGLNEIVVEIETGTVIAIVTATVIATATVIGEDVCATFSQIPLADPLLIECRRR